MVSLTFPDAGTKPWGAQNNANLTALNEGKVENSDFEAYKTQVSTSLSARAVKADVDTALAARVLTSTYSAFLTQHAADLSGKLATTVFTQFQSDLAGTLAGKSNTGHVHSALDITTGLLGADRLGLGSTNTIAYRTGAGTLGPIGFSATKGTNSLVQRDGNGLFTINTPTAADNPTTKAYVDGVDSALSTRIDGLGNSTPIRTWNKTDRTWPGLGGAVDPLIFMSTNDKTATAPADMRVDFDVWIPHVDATNA